MTEQTRKTIATILGNGEYHIGHITNINKEPYITQADLVALVNDYNHLRDAAQAVITCFDAEAEECSPMFVACIDTLEAAV